MDGEDGESTQWKLREAALRVVEVPQQLLITLFPGQPPPLHLHFLAAILPGEIEGDPNVGWR